MLGQKSYLKSIRFDMLCSLWGVQLHKSFGVVLIIAVILHVLVRFLTRAPDLPGELSSLDVKLWSMISLVLVWEYKGA